MKTYLPAIALPFFFLCVTAVAQTPAKSAQTIAYITHPSAYNDFPDSVRIELPDQKALIIFQFRKISGNVDALEDFQRRLRVWIAQLATAFPNTTTPQQVIIHVNEKDESEMKADPSVKSTRIKSNSETVTELLPPGWEIVVFLKGVNVYVYAQTFRDLESASQVSLTPVREKIAAHISILPMRRKGLVARYILHNNEVTYSDEHRRVAGDFLELNGGGSFGFTGNKFYPELDVTVNLRFGGRYGKNRHKISILYQNLFFAGHKADGSFFNQSNAFASVAWSLNMNSGKGQPDWLGVGAGVLINRSGPYFPGQTIKFFILQSLGHLTISPEFYLTNGVKNFQSGFRLAYTF